MQIETQNKDEKEEVVMSKKSKEKKQKQQTSVEFGMEFGDMNASKLYEVPAMNQDKSKRKK